MREYSIPALADIPTAANLADVVTRRIAALPGIDETTTLVAFRAYSRHDLEAIWDIGPA